MFRALARVVTASSGRCLFGGGVTEAELRVSFKHLKRTYATEPGVVTQWNHVRWEQDTEGVRWVTLCNPKTRNALSMECMEEIKAALVCDEIDHERLRTLVIDSEGPVFSAGHNLKELRSRDGISHHEDVFKTCTSMIMAVRNMHVPVIAKVRGLAAAAGCQLVATCDIVIAGDKASFSTPGVNFGLFCSTPGIALVRNVPMKLASYMLFTGRPIDAQTALRAGLVSCVVPDEELDAKTAEVVGDIVGKSKAVLSLGKDFLYRQSESPTLHNALKEGEQIMVRNLRYRDAQEGIKSFVEKRKPEWSHKKLKAH